ncbi:hypothetical protein GQ53DRAFT_212379 [Thozetella sp. PMI_491]|nr:hypothetical protein GQ53DRAFT_212379 [Thozetella sp. PMI_491]
MSSPATVSSDDDDPVVASFDILLKAPFHKERALYVLQYPNRATDNPERLHNPEIETMRVKPKTGMVEVDVPLDYNANYDKKKGVAWGSALKKSMEGKGASGSLGLAGGFGVSSAPGRRGRQAGGAAPAADTSGQAEWAEALRTNNVLSTQTMGGMNVVEHHTRYAVGVFQGGSLHLTPVENLVHLRPALHHLDAMSEQERAARPPAPGQTGTGKDGGGAKAIHMTIKSAMGEDEVIETMKDRLRAVQQEKWRRFEYVHDENEAAWEAYNEALFVEGATKPSGDDSVMVDANSGAAKGKEPASAGGPRLRENMDTLEGTWDENELLRVVGGRGDEEEEEEELSAAAQNLDLQSKVKEESGASAADKDGAPKRRPGRPPKNAAAGPATGSASASKKPARGKGRAATGAD